MLLLSLEILRTQTLATWFSALVILSRLPDPFASLLGIAPMEMVATLPCKPVHQRLGLVARPSSLVVLLVTSGSVVTC
jgi:hypothetical protein